MSTDAVFMWEGKEQKTMGDIIEIMRGLTNQDEIKYFIAKYRMTFPEHGDENMDYAVARYFHEYGESPAKITMWKELLNDDSQQAAS